MRSEHLYISLLVGACRVIPARSILVICSISSPIICIELDILSGASNYHQTHGLRLSLNWEQVFGDLVLDIRKIMLYLGRKVSHWCGVSRMVGREAHNINIGCSHSGVFSSNICLLLTLFSYF